MTFKRLSPADFVSSLDPLDIEIEPGFKVRQLCTPAECAAAISKIENDLSSIASQIARAEINPASVAPGWRTKAQNAQRWKKRAIRAIRDYAMSLAAANGSEKEKRRIYILRVIEEEIGTDAMDRFVAIARQRHPEAFGSIQEAPE